jgi:hypothetical protein
MTIPVLYYGGNLSSYRCNGVTLLLALIAAIFWICDAITGFIHACYIRSKAKFSGPLIGLRLVGLLFYFGFILCANFLYGKGIEFCNHNQKRAMLFIIYEGTFELWRGSLHIYWTK